METRSNAQLVQLSLTATMAPPTPTQDREDSQNRDDDNVEGAPEALRRRLASMPGLSGQPSPIQSLRPTEDASALGDDEFLSGNAQAASALSFQIDSLPSPAQFEALAVARRDERIMRNSAELQRMQRGEANMLVPITPRQTPLHQVQTGRQHAPLQSTQQPDQARSNMPSLRSQPEFYMTGVAAIDTAAEPLSDDAECTICLEPLSDDVVKFHACGHLFHTVCVQSWFDQSAPRTGKKRGTCPNCRHELYEPDPRYRQSRTTERPGVTAPPIFTAERPAPTTIRVVRAPEREPRRAQPVNEEQEQQIMNGPEAVRITPRALDERRSWGDAALGFQVPSIDSSERARDHRDMTRERTPPRLPPVQPNFREEELAAQEAQALARQQASMAMSQATRRAALPLRDPGPGDRQVHPTEPDDSAGFDNAFRRVGTVAWVAEPPTAPTSTSDGNPAEPRESRATLALRAIAERRPLTQDPGLNNGDADLPRPVQVPTIPSPFANIDRTTQPQLVPYFSPEEARRLVGIRDLPVARPDLASRSTQQLRDEQAMLLDRLNAVQIQIGRNLAANGVNREREVNDIQQDDTSTRRPPPIAIPRLVDPSVSDLRSSREFPDPRALGMGTTIWSTDYVAPLRDTWGGLIPSRGSDTVRETQRQRVPDSPGNGRSTVTPRILNEGAMNDGQASSPASTTRSETMAATQPASRDDPSAAPEDMEPIQFARREISTVNRSVQDALLSLRRAPIEHGVLSQPRSPRVRLRGATAHRRARAIAEIERQNHAALEAQSEPPQDSDAGSNSSETLG